MAKIKIKDREEAARGVALVVREVFGLSVDVERRGSGADTEYKMPHCVDAVADCQTGQASIWFGVSDLGLFLAMRLAPARGSVMTDAETALAYRMGGGTRSGKVNLHFHAGDERGPSWVAECVNEARNHMLLIKHGGKVPANAGAGA